MRRVICSKLGDPSQLELEEVADPRPLGSQVVLDVKAAGVNYVDGLMVKGGYQIKPPLPFTPGSEVAGVISEVGPDVEGWVVGERAFVTAGLGGFSDKVVARASDLHRLPQSLDLSQAASFVQSYATMLFAFKVRDRLQAGEHVLVLGAGGGIGLAAIDLARSLGARAIAAASSTDKLRVALAAGAEHGIDYESEDLKTRTRELTSEGAQVVVDPVGGPYSEAALRALRLFGRYLVVGFAAGKIPSVPLNHVLLNNRSIIGIDWGGWAAKKPDANRELIDDLISLAGKGLINPAKPTVLPLSEAGQVLSRIMTRRITGKVVLAPDI